MPIPQGTEVYTADAPPVVARGYTYSQAELETARAERIQAILHDEPGQASLADLYNSLELTEFGSQNVAEALEMPAEEEHSRGWREGEALAEAWLSDHRHCEFPWPFNRDLRHHRASLPGAELVGFAGDADSDARFAFGQVKTSKESKIPPQVVTNGDKSLINQLLQLRDDKQIKKSVVNYLAYRSQLSAPWNGKFRVAASKYLNSGTMDVLIFGVLVRDVDPVPGDLAAAAVKLSNGCHPSTQIEFCGLYLPKDSIPQGPQHGPRQLRRPGA